MRNPLIAATGISGVVLFAGTAILGGAQFDAYSQVSQFISETYATGTPWGPKLRWMGFVPAGGLLACFGLASAWLHRSDRAMRWGFVGLGIWYGLGTVVVALAPCDMGCDPQQPSPTLAHQVHFFAGGLTYLLTPPSILLIAFASARWHRLRSVRHMLVVAGLLMLTGTILLFNGIPRNALGLVQRITEAAALATVLLVAWRMLDRSTEMDRT